MNEKHYEVIGTVLVAAFLGTTALMVSFGAASAAEHSAVGEIVAACIAAGLYLAFCEFWLAPRGNRFLHKLPSLLAVLAPSVATAHSWTRPVPWLISACIGALVGASLAQMVTLGHRTTVPEPPAVNGRSRCRNFLLAGFIMLLAVALLILVGVLPPVLADTTPGFRSASAGSFLVVTVLFAFLAALRAGSSLWRHRGNDPLSKTTLGMIAFVALFLTLSYAGSIGVGAQHPGMRTALVLLAVCSFLAFVVTTLATVASVIVDRARLSTPAV
jgi:hypothetical protein